MSSAQPGARDGPPTSSFASAAALPNGVVLHQLGTIDSTQLLARRLLGASTTEHVDTAPAGHSQHRAQQLDLAGLDLSQPNCFVATSQTGGTGRTGKLWASPAGGVWFTLMWPVVPSALPVARPRPTMPQTLHGLGLKVGMAVLDAIRAVLIRAGLDDEIARLKWPNDIFIHDRKVAGMICEVVPSPRTQTFATPPTLLIGVGINTDFTADQLPEPLRATATTLRDVLGAPIDSAALRDGVLTRLSAAMLTPGLPPTTLAAAYAALFRAGDRHTVTLPDGSRIEGVLTGLSPEGLAVLRLDDGSRLTLASGVIH